MKSITVLGGGESGIGAALLAQKNGINVLVSDYGKIKDEFKEELLKYKIPFEEEGHTFEEIEKTELIVISPGIPMKSAVVQHFRLRNKRIISEIEFAFKFYSGKIAAITGSNGKTTTTSLTYEILKQSNLKVGLGGNIGYSFARLLASDLEYDWVVLELSSFQLEGLFDFQADISAIINITPDHLDRYDYDFKKYASAKWKLAEHTKLDGLLILNNDNSILKELSIDKPIKTKVTWLSSKDKELLISKEINKKFEINLFGEHNAYNCYVAQTIAERVGLKFDVIQKGFTSFKPIEHRLETIATHNGVLYVNDSKATNVESAEVAINAFDNNLIWIAGGTDKGNDYSIISEAIKKNVKTLICLCEDDSKLKSAFKDAVNDIVSFRSMEEAVKYAVNASTVGDTVLLSPACASFDLFDNYVHRGNEFKKAVFKYINEVD